MKKASDCVEMKRKGAAALRKKLAGLTSAQELANWKARDAKLRDRQQGLRRK
jgi:hypothetical protein